MLAYRFGWEKNFKQFLFANFLGSQIEDTKNGKKYFLNFSQKMLGQNFGKNFLKKHFDFFFAFLEYTSHEPRKLSKTKLLFVPPSLKPLCNGRVLETAAPMYHQLIKV